MTGNKYTFLYAGLCLDTEDLDSSSRAANQIT
jgi:hypothetical protein